MVSYNTYIKKLLMFYTNLELQVIPQVYVNLELYVTQQVYGTLQYIHKTY